MKKIKLNFTQSFIPFILIFAFPSCSTDNKDVSSESTLKKVNLSKNIEAFSSYILKSNLIIQQELSKNDHLLFDANFVTTLYNSKNEDEIKKTFENSGMKNSEVILNLLKKIIKEDEDTFIDITNMDDDSAAETVISKKDIFKKLRDKMSDKDRTPGGYEYGEIVSGQMGEELHGGQSKIDVASPKGKITADDFKKLRDGKKSNKSEVGENIFKKMFGKKEDPEVAREKDRKENPSLWDAGYEYVNDIVGWQVPEPGQSRFRDPKDKEIEEGMYGSFDDEHGWYDKDDRQHTGDFDFDFDEEEFSDFDSLMNKHGENQRWFGPKDGKMYFDKYQEKFDGKPFRVRTRKNEMGEGNAFSGALANAKKDGKNSFEVDGKTYQVKESKRTNSVGEKVVFTESELINFIERLVEAEKVVDKGFKTAMNTTKKENTSAIKQVAAKMKDYMKNMGTEYEENPQSFPKGNKIMSREDFGKEVSDDKKNAYDASDAVDEYIDAFAYPGQTNLVFDEIKPDDTKIEKYLKGHSTTGNAQVDEDGNALGNVVPSEVGEKFYKNYKENLYGAEQMNASYKRQPAPVDIAGSEKSNGNLKSLKASQQIFNKLEESVENKKVISEMEKMKNLIGYNRKTQ